jgi:hypothetical protein
MTKEFLNENTLEVVAKQFDQELQEFGIQVSEITELDQLDTLEEEIMKEQDEVNEYLRTVQYQLPDSAVFDGEKYSLNDIAKNIVYFINKREVEWKYTLGLYQLVKFWKSQNPTVIDYGVYDSTLRILNQNSFKGYQEWKDILACNEYLKSAHESYSKDTSWLIFVSEKHNMIMTRREDIDKSQKDIAE